MSKKNNKKRTLRNKSKCLGCRTANKEVGSKCYSCWLRVRSYKHFRSTRYWEKLRDLLHKQNHRCAYSGRVLIPGPGVHIDHVEPHSKHPLRRADIKNIVWVSREVNLMKGNMSLVEFINLCKDILKHFGYKVER